jgi:Family of unknown function (DUF6572)
MAIDDPGVVDIISLDPAGSVVLQVSDHLDWDDSIQHQLTLQEKLNRYLAFIESGEILESYPGARGRPVMIEVVTQHDPDAGGLEFLEKAKMVIEQAGFAFRHTRFGKRI